MELCTVQTDNWCLDVWLMSNISASVLNLCVAALFDHIFIDLLDKCEGKKQNKQSHWYHGKTAILNAWRAGWIFKVKAWEKFAGWGGTGRDKRAIETQGLTRHGAERTRVEKQSFCYFQPLAEIRWTGESLSVSPGQTIWRLPTLCFTFSHDNNWIQIKRKPLKKYIIVPKIAT